MELKRALKVLFSSFPLFLPLFLSTSLRPSLSYAFPLPLSSFQFHPLYHSVFLAVLLRFCEGKALARLPGYRHTHRLEASFNYKNPVVLCPFIFTTFFFENLALSLSRHTNTHVLDRSDPSFRNSFSLARNFATFVIKIIYFFVPFYIFSFFFCFSFNQRTSYAALKVQR